jgi:hypothetical protein
MMKKHALINWNLVAYSIIKREIGFSIEGGIVQKADQLD